MKFTIDVLPEAEARLVREQPVQIRPTPPLFFAARAGSRLERVELGIAELDWLGGDRRRVVRIRGVPQRGTRHVSRATAGRRIEVELLGLEESRRLFATWRRRPDDDYLPGGVRDVLVERSFGLEQCPLQMREMRCVPDHMSMAVVRITADPLSVFQTLAGEVRPTPARRRL